MKLKVLNDKILVEVNEPKRQTSGGIYLPETSNEKLSTGKVIAVGEGYLLNSGEFKPLGIKVGQTVHFPAFSGQKLNDYLIMKENDILAVEVK